MQLLETVMKRPGFDIKRYVKKAARPGAFVRTREHTLNVLGDHDLSRIIDLRSIDFQWEDL